MTFAKASSLAVGFVGAMALGVWTGPYITQQWTGHVESPAMRATESGAATGPSSAAPRQAVVRAPVSRIAPSAPELHARLKPVLAMGTDLNMASEGFRDSEQFATVAYAARNTDVPFVVLKHRVLTEDKSLTAAIRELKPAINAPIEVERARAEARSTLASIGS